MRDMGTPIKWLRDSLPHLLLNPQCKVGSLKLGARHALLLRACKEFEPAAPAPATRIFFEKITDNNGWQLVTPMKTASFELKPHWPKLGALCLEGLHVSIQNEGMFKKPKQVSPPKGNH